MNQHLGCPPCKILGTILEKDQEIIHTNGTANKKVDNDACER